MASVVCSWELGGSVMRTSLTWRIHAWTKGLASQRDLHPAAIGGAAVVVVAGPGITAPQGFGTPQQARW